MLLTDLVARSEEAKHKAKKQAMAVADNQYN